MAGQTKSGKRFECVIAWICHLLYPNFKITDPQKAKEAEEEYERVRGEEGEDAALAVVVHINGHQNLNEGEPGSTIEFIGSNDERAPADLVITRKEKDS